MEVAESHSGFSGAFAECDRGRARRLVTAEARSGGGTWPRDSPPRVRSPVWPREPNAHGERGEQQKRGEPPRLSGPRGSLILTFVRRKLERCHVQVSPAPFQWRGYPGVTSCQAAGCHRLASTLAARSPVARWRRRRERWHPPWRSSAWCAPCWDATCRSGRSCLGTEPA